MDEELEAALIKFHDLYWNHTGTFEFDGYDGKYSLISNADMVDLDDAAEKVEKLLANRKIVG